MKDHKGDLRRLSGRFLEVLRSVVRIGADADELI
jgi:hypothetical protein